MATGPYAVQFETLRTVAFGSITNSFVAVGDPLANPAVMVKCVNTTDVELQVSDDGTNAKISLPSGAASLYDFNANRLANANIYAVAAGTQFYVKYLSAPSRGNFSIEAIH